MRKRAGQKKYIPRNSPREIRVDAARRKRLTAVLFSKFVGKSTGDVSLTRFPVKYKRHRMENISEFFHRDVILFYFIFSFFFATLMPDRRIAETRDDEENAKITSTCKHVDESTKREDGKSRCGRVGRE